MGAAWQQGQLRGAHAARRRRAHGAHPHRCAAFGGLRRRAGRRAGVGSAGGTLWNEVSKTKWSGDKRRYVVGARGGAPAALGSAGRAAARPYKLMIEDASLPDGFYRDEGGVVRVGKVQSFAAGYIAHEL